MTWIILLLVITSIFSCYIFNLVQHWIHKSEQLVVKVVLGCPKGIPLHSRSSQKASNSQNKLNKHMPLWYLTKRSLHWVLHLNWITETSRDPSRQELLTFFVAVIWITHSNAQGYSWLLRFNPGSAQVSYRVRDEIWIDRIQGKCLISYTICLELILFTLEHMIL